MYPICQGQYPSINFSTFGRWIPALWKAHPLAFPRRCLAGIHEKFSQKHWHCIGLLFRWLPVVIYSRISISMKYFLPGNAWDKSNAHSAMKFTELLGFSTTKTFGIPFVGETRTRAFFIMKRHDPSNLRYVFNGTKSPTTSSMRAVPEYCLSGLTAINVLQKYKLVANYLRTKKYKINFQNTS